MIARLTTAAIMLIAVSSPAFAQLSKDTKLVAPFKQVVAKANESTVRIRCDDKDSILGTVVYSDGYILTKLSELKGVISVRLSDGTEYEATTVASHPKTDLALLKVDVQGLKAIEFADTKKVPAGHWVAASGPTSDPVSIGIVSVKTRNLTERDASPPTINRGYLGIFPADEKDEEGKLIGAKINELSAGQAAEKAGLKANDVIVEMNGKKIVSQATLREFLEPLQVGDVVTVKAKRKGETKEFKVTLGGAPKDRGDIQNAMGSELSTWRTGFPQVLQTDMVVNARDCGGPVVDLDGKVLGINIARAGRVETWVLPSEVIRPLLPEFKAGKFAPRKPVKLPAAPAPRESDK